MGGNYSTIAEILALRVTYTKGELVQLHQSLYYEPAALNQCDQNFHKTIYFWQKDEKANDSLRPGLHLGVHSPA